MFDGTPHKENLKERLESARNLVRAGHASTPEISKEVRGLAIVLIYAAYENLMTAVCRSLLEGAASTRARNRRLRPGLKLFAAYSKLESLTKIGGHGIWKGPGRELMDLILDSQSCTIDPGVFPTDGSHMRRGQVKTICDLFGLGNPAPILREVWEQLDGVVSERNAIAHGRETADSIGRRYSEPDIQAKIDLWEKRWIEFIDWIELHASKREFYLLPR